MPREAVTLFFALLAVAAELGALSIVVLAVGARWSTFLRSQRDRVFAELAPQAVVLAFVVATVATLGSLYLSEVAHFAPCRLCWYQRGAMYPLVPILGVLAWRDLAWLRWLATVLPLAGGIVSVWHLLIERYPNLDSGSCDPLNRCSLVWVRHLGYLTIPAMALSGFALIAALLYLTHRSVPD